MMARKLLLSYFELCSFLLVHDSSLCTQAPPSSTMHHALATYYNGVAFGIPHSTPVYTFCFSGTRQSSSCSPFTWHLDTGASHHMINSTRHLNSFQPYHGYDSVYVSDGTWPPITHIGNKSLTSLSSPFSFNQVLVVLKLTKNLLSVR